MNYAKLQSYCKLVLVKLDKFAYVDKIAVWAKNAMAYVNAENLFYEEK